MPIHNNHQFSQQDRLYHTIQNSWNDDDGGLIKQYKVLNFMDGVAMIQQIGEIAEMRSLKPNIYLEDDNHLTVKLTRHRHQLTQEDYLLAQELDQAFDLL